MIRSLGELYISDICFGSCGGSYVRAVGSGRDDRSRCRSTVYEEQLSCHGKEKKKTEPAASVGTVRFFSGDRRVRA